MSSKSATRPIALGVIGLGGISRFYLDAISRSPESRVSAVCDIDATRRGSVDVPGAEVYGDPAQLLADPRVDAVVIDTPVRTHVPLCQAALAAGKHVCCEKPLALSRGEAGSLLRLASARGLTLFTAFHRRYNRWLPAPASVRLDGLLSIESRYYEQIEDHAEGSEWYSSPASEGGGCVVDNGPNAFDVVRHLFGAVSVTGGAVTRSPAGVDLAAVIIGAAAGAEVSIRLDWEFDGECKDVRVRWSDGTALHIDLLEGSAGFKSSLEHEYDGVLADFVAHVADRRQDQHGFAATAWLEDTLRSVSCSVNS